MGRPKFTSKTASSPSTITTLSNTPIPTDPPHHPKRHLEPFSHFATVHFQDRQTDRHTHRPTDGLGDRSTTPLALTLATLIESDALKIKVSSLFSKHGVDLYSVRVNLHTFELACFAAEHCSDSRGESAQMTGYLVAALLRHHVPHAVQKSRWSAQSSVHIALRLKLHRLDLLWICRRPTTCRRQQIRVCCTTTPHKSNNGASA